MAQKNSVAVASVPSLYFLSSIGCLGNAANRQYVKLKAMKGQTGNNGGRSNTPRSNEQNPMHTRDNTEKHRYEDYDQELTNDELYTAGKPDDPQKMDFRDKLDNLDDENNKDENI